MNKADNTQFDEKSYVDKQFNILESERKDIEEEYENGRRKNEKNAEELQKLAVQKEEKMKNAVNNYYTKINQKRKEEEDKISKHFENLIDQAYNTMEFEKKRNDKEGITKDWPESVINKKNLEAEKKYNNSLLKIKEEREKINKNKPEKEIKRSGANDQPTGAFKPKLPQNPPDIPVGQNMKIESRVISFVIARNV